jgi:hypothetical protein
MSHSWLRAPILHMCVSWCQNRLRAYQSLLRERRRRARKGGALLMSSPICWQRSSSEALLYARQPSMGTSRRRKLSHYSYLIPSNRILALRLEDSCLVGLCDTRQRDVLTWAGRGASRGGGVARWTTTTKYSLYQSFFNGMPSFLNRVTLSLKSKASCRCPNCQSHSAHHQ